MKEELFRIYAYLFIHVDFEHNTTLVFDKETLSFLVLLQVSFLVAKMS